MFTQPEILMFLIGCTLTMSVCVWYYEPKLHRSSTSHQSQESSVSTPEPESSFTPTWTGEEYMRRYFPTKSGEEASIPAVLFDDDPFADKPKVDYGKDW